MRLPRSRAPLAAGALALAGGGLLLARRARSGGALSSFPSFASSTGPDGCPAGSSNNPPPSTSSDAGAAARVPEVAERLRRLWSSASGDPSPPCEAAIQILIAHSWLEGGLGGWWTDKTATGGGDMRGSGNLGARQCSGAGVDGSYFRCVEYGDSRPNADGTQTKIPAKFRYYTGGVMPDGVKRDAADAAAWDFIHDVTQVWGALAELKSGDVRRYVTRLHDKGYYQGFGATTEERVNGYGRAVASRLPGAAHALGDHAILAIVAPEFYQGKAYVAPSKISGLGGPLLARRDHSDITGDRILWYAAEGSAS